MTEWIAWTTGADGRADYVADLPGCDGREKNGTRCGYGFVPNHEKALSITEREWNHFSRQCRDLQKPAFCSPA